MVRTQEYGSLIGLYSTFPRDMPACFFSLKALVIRTAIEVEVVMTAATNY